MAGYNLDDLKIDLYDYGENGYALISDPYGYIYQKDEEFDPSQNNT